MTGHLPDVTSALHRAATQALTALDALLADSGSPPEAALAARYDLSHALTMASAAHITLPPPGRDATVAVDFDKVIHTYEHGWGDGTIYGDLMPGARDGLAALMGRYAIFVHTSRDPGLVAKWLRERDIPAMSLFDLRMAEGLSFRLPTFWTRRDVILVTNDKLPALAYLDDRAVPFLSWPHALTVLLPDPPATPASPGCVQ